MSWLRTLFVGIGVVQVIGLIVFLNTAGAEVFEVAYSLSYVQDTWVLEPLERFELVAYTLIVPIFFLDLLIYQAIGSIQTERERQVMGGRY
ncbi:hypothetical protein [Haloprofundus halobius]|uniref:hypothetical protein n=1 Tax=Haloprofundus halobius TaxID=2876194 RepID=UPI001CCEBF10|nr:hypothetical protein [Haloprofundus halobius]